MQPKDKISKAEWNHFQGACDSVVKNISAAIRDGKLKVDASSTQQLIGLITASLEQGFHAGSNVFSREVVTVLSEVEKTTTEQCKKKLTQENKIAV